MAFVTGSPEIVTENPLFCSILANTSSQPVPGISGAGPSPEKTLLTPILDAELIVHAFHHQYAGKAEYTDRLPDPGLHYTGDYGTYRPLPPFYQWRSCAIRRQSPALMYTAHREMIPGSGMRSLRPLTYFRRGSRSGSSSAGIRPACPWGVCSRRYHYLPLRAPGAWLRCPGKQQLCQ